MLMAPIMIAGLLFAALAAYTVINGELRLPFGGGVVFAFNQDAAESTSTAPRKGMVAVLACPRPLPAFTKITRDHLLTEEGLFTVSVVEPAIEQIGLFRADNQGMQQLLGRVLKREKPIGYAFSARDFLPKGTRPGPNAGIPPGKRGVWVDVSKVQGLADMHAGDLVDLVAATSDKEQSKLDTSVLGNLADPVMKARLQAAATQASKASNSSSWVVARNAKVITPMRSRPASSSGKKRGAESTVDEVFLAMTPADVAQFGEALAQKLTLLAAPRSSQPNDQPTEILDSRPADANTELHKLLLGEGGETGSFGMVEVIQGGERKIVTVPRSQTKNQKR